VAILLSKNSARKSSREPARFWLTVDSNGRTIWIADAHRKDGRRFIVHADEKLTAFVELESGIEGASGWLQQLGQMTRVRSRSSRKLCACVTSRNSSGVR